MDGVYFRIRRDVVKGTICIAQMQDFDEGSYDQTLFLTKKRFATEKKARKYITKMQGRWAAWPIEV